MPKMDGEAIMDFAFDFFISFIYFYLYLISLKADLSAKTLAVCAACRGRNISLFFFSKKKSVPTPAAITYGPSPHDRLFYQDQQAEAKVLQHFVMKHEYANSVQFNTKRSTHFNTDCKSTNRL